MVKPIELDPEWVLTELSDALYADGCGNMSVDTYSLTEAKWIKLALNTLHIDFQETVYGESDMTFVDIEFCIDDLKINCPALYKEMMEMDAKNRLFKGLNIN